MRQARLVSEASRRRRFGWLRDLPSGVLAATVLALLVGGFGLLGTSTAVGGIVGSVISAWRENPGRSEYAVWSLLSASRSSGFVPAGAFAAAAGGCRLGNRPAVQLPVIFSG